MSFSLEIKREIIENKAQRLRHKTAQAYGLFLFSRSFGSEEISHRCEYPEIADLFQWFAVSLLGKKTQVKRTEEMRANRRVYSVSLPNEQDRMRLLELFGHREDTVLNHSLLEADGSVPAFLSGTFIACGNITDPQKSYHLELALRSEDLCERLMQILDYSIPGVRKTFRRGRPLAYYKECVQIEDFLTLIGATKASLAMIDVEMIKNVRNQANRATNCETANIDKQVDAAATQLENIRLVLDQLGEDKLSPKLQEAARLRLENPEASLRELADISPEKVSRSGLHHRLAALSKLAEEIRQGTK